MGPELIAILFGVFVVLALSVQGLLFLADQLTEDTAEKAERAVLNEVSTGVKEEYESFDEWEQSQILFLADDVKEFEKTVKMWRPED